MGCGACRRPTWVEHYLSSPHLKKPDAHRAPHHSICRPLPDLLPCCACPQAFHQRCLVQLTARRLAAHAAADARAEQRRQALLRELGLQQGAPEAAGGRLAGVAQAAQEGREGGGAGRWCQPDC